MDIDSQKPRTILNSWKEISSYLRRGIRTVQRWELLYGMPVHRPAGKTRSAVVAFSDELDQWLNGKAQLTQELECVPDRIGREAALLEELRHYGELLRERGKRLQEQTRTLATLVAQARIARQNMPRLAAARKQLRQQTETLAGLLLQDQGLPPGGEDVALTIPADAGIEGRSSADA